MNSISELENPFSVLKATEFNNQEIRDYWVDFGSGENSIFKVLNPTEYLPKYLIGSKGSGKTHILKYASYPLQKLKAENDFKKVLNDKYIGLHFETYALKISRFKGRGLDDEQWKSIFEYYFDLYLIDDLLAVYKELIDELKIKIKDEMFIKIEDIFNDKSDIIKIKTIDDLIFVIENIRKNLDTEINNVAFTKKIDLNKVKLKFNPGDLIFGIPSLFCKYIKEFNDIKVIFIIDEFEKFEEWQKIYINTLIWDKQAPVSFWVGMRTHGYTTLNTKTADILRIDHELKIIDLDLINSKDEKRYFDFATKLYSNRLIKYYKSKSIGLSDEEILKIFNSKFEKYDEEELIKYFTEKGRKSPLKHEIYLKNKKVNSKNIPNVNEVIKLLKDMVESNVLHEKYKYFMFYFLWNKEKEVFNNDFISLAKKVNLEYDKFILGEISFFDKIKDKRKKDLIAQLCYENGEISKNIEHTGIDSFISRSQSNPRNLLMLLMKSIEFSNLKNDKPLTNDGIITVENQYFAVYDTAKWFYESIEVTGEDAKKLYNSLYFLTEILKINRYCDKPTETNVFGFNVSLDDLTVNSKTQIKLLEKYSVIISDKKGRKEKNSSIIENRYNLNKILCPLWGLPITKRGVLDFNEETSNIIFDFERKDFFDNLYKNINKKLNAPFVYIDNVEQTVDQIKMDL